MKAFLNLTGLLFLKLLMPVMNWYHADVKRAA